MYGSFAYAVRTSEASVRYEMAAEERAAAPTALDRSTLLVAAVAMIGAFMALIDTTVVFVALDPLARDFGAAFTTIQWVATAYTLALAATFPLAGWAADRFGARRVYIAGLAIFVAGSVLCALAWTAESLIAFRVLQGVGGGLVLPAGMTIVTRKAGPHRRGRVMGILGVPLVAAPVIGPILGGWLVDDVSWHWVFLVNVPIGAIAIALAFVLLEREAPQPTQRLDWLGILLLSPGLALLLWGVAESVHTGSVVAQAPVLAGAALLVGFVVHAWRAPAPLIGVRLFLGTRAGAAAAVLLLANLAAFGTLLLIPLYHQSVRGASALEAGLLVAPWGAGVMAMLPLSGWLTDRIGPRPLPPIGLALMVGGMVPYALIAADSSPVALGASAFLLGVGDALVFVPTTTAVLTLVPAAAIARTSTTVQILNESAASVGTAVVSVLLAASASGNILDGHLAGTASGGSAVPHTAGVGELAGAFSVGFGWMLAVLTLALIPALALTGVTARFRSRAGVPPRPD